MLRSQCTCGCHKPGTFLRHVRPCCTPDPHPLDAKYQIGTDIIGDGLIRQTTIDLAGEFQQRILDTKEAQVRAKLIELGWTPPNP